MHKNKALFLDRDGVINAYAPYVHTREEFHFLDGIFELCRAAQSLDYLLCVVTNQAGIGRGYFTESDFLQLTEWMVSRFSEQQVRIARVYFCPNHPEHGVGKYKCDSPDRKPNPGMILRARADFDLDLAESILVGDKLLDMDAGKAAGVGTNILLQSAAEPSGIQEDRFYIAHSHDDIRARFFSPAHSESARGVTRA
jgi:D-glycero-D-manno-heptose 1,7-bisphosphate phosphatase